MTTIETTGVAAKEAMDGAMKSFSVMTKGLQQIATETTDFTKRSYEHSAKTFGEISQTRSLEKVMEIQGEFAKSAYQAWVSQATRMGELYASLAKESYKPFEQAIASATTTMQAAGKTA